MRLNTFAGAQTHFDKAILIDPTHYRALFSRGYCQSRLGEKR